MFYEVGQVGAGTTSLVDTDAVDTGSFDPGSTVYEVQAMFPNGGLSAAVTAMVSNTPAAPSGLTATVDSTGTNVILTWSPATGTATGYTIFRGTSQSKHRQLQLIPADRDNNRRGCHFL